jgi:Fe-S-cluster containining protein
MIAPHAVDTGGCTGSCCERFTLRAGYVYVTPENLQQRIEDSRKAGNEDELFTLEMLVYIGYSNVASTGVIEQVPSHWWTCKYFDSSTRLCTVYEKRPRMCRTYGEAGYSPCQYPGCQRARRKQMAELKEKEAVKSADKPAKETQLRLRGGAHGQ